MEALNDSSICDLLDFIPVHGIPMVLHSSMLVFATFASAAERVIDSLEKLFCARIEREVLDLRLARASTTKMISGFWSWCIAWEMVLYILGFEIPESLDSSS